MIDLLFRITPLWLLVQGIWRDEGFSYMMARQNIFEIIHATAHDFNPPLYYFLLHYWMKPFGTSEIAMRSLSLVFFAITIYIADLFLVNVLKIKNKRTWIYLLLFSLNPFLLYYAFEARMYALVALLTMLSFYYFATKHKRLYTLFTTLGLYTHYFFIFVLASQWLYLVTIEKKTLKQTFIKIAYPFLFFLPWLLYVSPTIVTKTAHFWMQKATLYDILTAPALLLTGYERNYYSFYTISIVLLSFFLFFVILFISRMIKRSKLFYLLFIWSFIWFLIILFVSVIKPLFTPRYILFAAVGFNFFLFYGIEQIGKMRTLILTILFIFIVHFWMLQMIYRVKGEERATINSIKQIATNSDLLYVTDAKMYFVAAYYFDKERVYIYKKNSETIPDYVGTVLIPENKIITNLPLFPSKAFILTSDRTYEIKTAL